ncbi:uncharacterized protein EDB91DRAFT_1050809 [Suillus paluster]|uniref:uncharacterized protein n=1 Tax=Suillus paluster TaxID=48578 RepID=UPI001B88372A|nr:uncharacterized protein EDB91DRAFT_1050809 [Suillus paluster]KAG1744098.1 hypothetical protein EDB91DRAFT_1050809 [Suillus paluster]
MQPTSQFPFVHLSTELVLLILRYASRPTFFKTHKNPYSSALSLCRVSKIIRRTVLPEILHTVLLSEYHNMTAFVHALRLQNTYAQQGNHLHFNYAAHIRKIWFGQICEPPPQAPMRRNFALYAQSESDIDFSLLAPVLLSAPSLALDFGSLWLLYGCIESVWNSHVAMNIDHEHFPPWSTKSLTLVGDLIRWHPLTSSAEGSAFLASISRLTFLSPTTFDDLEPQSHLLPEWMASVPWASFKSLRTVSLVLPRIVITGAARTCISEENVDVELLTLSTPSMSSPWRHKSINAYTESGEGHVLSVDVRTKSEDLRMQFNVSYDWEEAWACGLL